MLCSAEMQCHINKMQVKFELELLELLLLDFEVQLFEFPARLQL